MTEQDARRILQVDEGSPPDTIRESYLHLVKVWHPDRFEHDSRLRARAERTLREVNEAYALLQQRRASPPSTPRETVRPAAAGAPVAEKTSAPLHVTLRRAVFAGAAFGVLAAIAFATWPSTAPAVVDGGPRDAPAVADAPGALAASARTARSAAPADTLRPLSGLGLAPGARDGNGSVVVVNQGDRDAAVALARGGEHVYATYVRAGEKVQLVGIASGDYDVFVTVGASWREDTFTADAAFLKHHEPLQVREPGAGEQLDRAVATLTLPASLSSARFAPTAPFRVQLSADK